MKITETEINVETGEEVTVERKLTAEEEAEIMANRAKSAEQTAEAEAKSQAKAALLSKLGITAEEAQLLLS